ncbi:MAG: phage tail sheath family protein [Methylocella sp.]
MPVLLTYPGVYIQELPSGVRSIIGVSTSLTAFIGRALRGPVNVPTPINSYADFNRIFGGLWAPSTLGYSVAQFFNNGGSQGLIVRVHNSAAAATAALSPGIGLIAASPGAWGANLTATVTASSLSTSANPLFNLTLTDTTTTPSTSETYLNVSTNPANPKFLVQVLAQQSQLANATGSFPASPAVVAIPTPQSQGFTGGSPGDGLDIGDTQVAGGGSGSNQGIYALDQVPIFNLLVIPPYTRLPSTNPTDVDSATWNAAILYAWGRRAFVIVDPPSSWTTAKEATEAANLLTALGNPKNPENAAIYFPYLLASDPLKNNLIANFAPSGTIAGIFAFTDAQRGVWKAPAGIAATLSGTSGLAAPSSTTPLTLTDNDSATLNPLGVNCLRNFPVFGGVVWGARTAAGADGLESQWKYIPIRRLALYIEQSLFQGTQWVVFEPNAEPLWAQIRLDIGAFMQTLFIQGAFQGTTPSQAYFVNCDSTTTTQTDIDNGIVNIVVGFAPLYPAEFVVIYIQQISPS